jgi:4-amino-4-deoxy-L-arabinose transferase-like glycosyltransferase
MVDLALPTAPAARLRWPARLIEAAALIGAIAVALWLRVPNLDAYTGSFDEGIRTEQLLLMAAGYRPFREIFASQGPLLLDVLFPFYLAFGQTLAAARAGVVACSVVALVASWWTARVVAGRWAALAAAVALALSPTFLESSRLALAEVPTLAPALLALACVLAYRRSSDRRLLVLSAALCALALLIKPMVLHVGAPLVVAVALPWGSSGTERGWSWPWRRILLDLLLYGLVVAVLCAAVVLALGPARVWDNLGAYRAGAGHGLGADVVANLRLTANVLRGEQAGLFVLAAIGAGLGLWRQPAATVALVAWIGGVLGLFALYGDLADKHVVYLVPPLVLLAALGAGLGVEAARSLLRSDGHDRSALVAAVVGATGLLAYLWSAPAVLARDRYLLREAPRIAAERRDRAADLEIAETVRSHTPPDGWVVADNPNAAFDARRKVIPYLVDTSGTRVDAGSLTSSLALEYIERYQPSVIVTWPRRLGKLDDFVRRLPSLGYRLDKSYEIGWKVYVRD